MDQLTTPHQTSVGADLGLVETNWGQSLSETWTETPVPGAVVAIPPLVISWFTHSNGVSQGSA